MVFINILGSRIRSGFKITISIDVKNKRYILDVDLEDWMTEGYDEEETDVVGTVCVSRFIFDIILNSIKEMGFVELHS